MSFLLSPVMMLLLIALLVAICAYILLPKTPFKKDIRSKAGSSAGSLVIGVGAVLIIFGPLLTKFVGFSEIVVKNGQVVYEGPGLIFRWDDRLTSNSQFASTSPLIVYAETNVQPITTNPKVRPLKIRLEVIARGSNQNTVEVVNRFTADNDEELKKLITHYVKYCLYNLMEEKSKELALFFNPEDSKQQVEFAGIIYNYLEPHLSPVGIRIQEAKFDLE